MSDPTGERHHEQCRFGTLTQAFRVTLEGAEAPMILPLCTWKPEGPTPPEFKRIWGGSIESVADCAACECYSPL